MYVLVCICVNEQTIAFLYLYTNFLTQKNYLTFLYFIIIRIEF